MNFQPGAESGFGKIYHLGLLKSELLLVRQTRIQYNQIKYKTHRQTVLTGQKVSNSVDRRR
jgi:hypothetical protein